MVSGPRIRARYLIETPLAPDHAASVMAGEQSTGTFVSLPAETGELLRRHAAVVESVEELESVSHPTLSSSLHSDEYRRATVELSFPLDNVGTALANIMATVAGNLFELRELTGIRLEDVELPDEVIRAHPGPAFGVRGTREIAGVEGRPIIGTIIKPSVGLSPADTGRLARELAAAGLDFVKDDELMANPPHSPFDDRLDAVLAGLREGAEVAGSMPLYAANVTDDLDAMLRHADTVHERGGNCLMVSLNAVGLVGVRALRERASVPIHGHRNGWGALTREPLLGYSFEAAQRFWRLAGVDHLHVNGMRNKFWEPDDSVIRSARACLEPGPGQTPVLPVFSSAQTAHQAADTYAALGSPDLMYVCGGGIFGHPGGAGAGVRSIREAWEAALRGVPVADYARSHPALARALDTFAPHAAL